MHADVTGVGATRRAVDYSILKLIVGCVSSHPAEELAAVLHENFIQINKKVRLRITDRYFLKSTHTMILPIDL